MSDSNALVVWPLPDSVEVRLPNSAWCKRVTAVAEKAKTGRDWQGSFEDSGRLIDATPGDLILGCCEVGSRKHPCKEATLYVVGDQGELVSVRISTSNEWAINLRDIAREFLGLDPAARLIKAFRIEAADIRSQEPDEVEAISKMRREIERAEKTRNPNDLISYMVGYKGEWAIEPRLEYARGCVARMEASIPLKRSNLEVRAQTWDDAAALIGQKLAEASTTRVDPRAEAIQQIRVLMIQHGITVADLTEGGA